MAPLSSIRNLKNILKEKFQYIPSTLDKYIEVKQTLNEKEASAYKADLRISTEVNQYKQRVLINHRKKMNIPKINLNGNNPLNGHKYSNISFGILNEDTKIRSSISTAILSHDILDSKRGYPTNNFLTLGSINIESTLKKFELKEIILLKIVNSDEKNSSILNTFHFEVKYEKINQSLLSNSYTIEIGKGHYSKIGLISTRLLLSHSGNHKSLLGLSLNYSKVFNITNNTKIILKSEYSYFKKKLKSNTFGIDFSTTYKDSLLIYGASYNRNQSISLSLRNRFYF